MSFSLEELVRIPSVTGDEGAVVSFLQERARADGLDVVEDAVGNFIARTGGSGPHIVFVGHVDTVPGEIPVRVEDGVLWGRGSVDAKAPLCAAYQAALRHRDANITIVGAVGEEGDSRGARALDLPSPDMIIIGEPSGWNGVTIAYKGLLRGTLTWRARPVHGGHPDPNAWDCFAAGWDTLRTAIHTGTGFDDVHLRLDGARSPAEDTVTADFQVRLPPQATPDQVRAAIEAAIPDATVAVAEALPAAASDKRSALVAAFRFAIRGAGATPRVLRKTGTADFNILADRYPGVPMVAYGPGDSSLDHTPEERIPLEDLDKAAAVWDACLTALTGPATTK